jgi:restriction system protein
MSGFLVAALLLLAVGSISQEILSLGCILLISISAYWGIPTILKLRHRWKASQRLRLLVLEDIDNMSGHAFEQYVARLLQDQGYRATLTKGSGDFGVDIVAQKNGARYAVQCKRQRKVVSRRAISDAVAGKHYYDCSEAMVVTNSYFTPGAIELARSTRCILVDRDKLAEWIAEFRRSGKKETEPEQQSSDVGLGR